MLLVVSLFCNSKSKFNNLTELKFKESDRLKTMYKNLKLCGADIERNKDGSINVQGSTEIRNINRSFGWDLPDEDANTISGLIINESRSFPKAGQVFQFYGFKFEIIETKRNLISQVKIASLN